MSSASRRDERLSLSDRAEDAEAHELLLCVQSGKVMSDEKRWRLGTDQLFVKSPEIMEAEFAEYPEALENTLDIASRCNLELSFGDFKFSCLRYSKRRVAGNLFGTCSLAKDLRSGLRLIRTQEEISLEKEQEYHERLGLRTQRH